MDAKQAAKNGAAAFRMGMKRAPALNPSFIREACSIATGRALSALFDAYMSGWDVANLANGAPSDFPSVAALKSLESA